MEKLSKKDILRLVDNVLLEEEGNNPLIQKSVSKQPTGVQTTQQNIKQQALSLLSKMVVDEESGMIVSIFLNLLTDKDSRSLLQSYGKKYGPAIKELANKNGGEVQFTSQMVGKLKPQLNNLMGTIIGAMKETYNQGKKTSNNSPNDKTVDNNEILQQALKGAGIE